MKIETIQPDSTTLPDLPELPQLRGVFVTATDTEVGKTFIAGGICRSLRNAGIVAEPFKPVASGCPKIRGSRYSEDAAFLAHMADTDRPMDEIVPVRLGPALAPNVAARFSRTTIDLPAIFDAYRRLDGSDAVVVEGVGGLLCPLTDEFSVLDFAVATGLPMVIVARPNLGTINHTLLTIRAAQAAGIDVVGVIVNRYEIDPKLSDEEAVQKGDAVLAMHTNPGEIRVLGGVPLLALVPDDPASSVADGTLGRDAQFAIDTVDWPSILTR